MTSLPALARWFDEWALLTFQNGTTGPLVELAGIASNDSPGIKVGRFTLSRISRVRFRIGDMGSGKIEKQLQCGTFEPGSDV